jgi:preprotein translocase subunit SecD
MMNTSMFKTTTLSLVLVAAALTAGCQQMPARASAQSGVATLGQPDVAPPPIRTSAASPAPARASAMAPAPATAMATSTAAQQTAKAPVVEFRLAQSQPDTGLQRVQIGNQVMWVLPQPVLTRSDVRSLVAVKSREGKDYVQFTFTPAAAPRLAEISQRYRGKYLLLSVDRYLVSAPTIGGPMTNGELFVPATSAEDARQIAALAAGAASPTVLH